MGREIVASRGGGPAANPPTGPAGRRLGALLVLVAVLAAWLPAGTVRAQDVPVTLTIDQLHIFLMPVEGRVLVSEYYLISNSGTEAYAGAGDAESNATLTIPLPEGASNVQPDEDTENVGRYQIREGSGTDGGAIIDTAPILPGSGTSEIRFSYELPLSAGAAVRREVPLATSSAVLLLTGDLWQLAGEQLMAFGEIDAGGGTAQAYTVDPLSRGDAIVFSIVPASAPAVATDGGTAAPTTRGLNEGLGVGVGVLAVVVAAVGVWALWGGRRSPKPPHALRGEIEALVTLEQRFEAGDLDAAAYREARRVVEARIRERLRQDGREDSAS